MKTFLPLLFLFSLCHLSKAQRSEPYQELHQYIQKQPVVETDTLPFFSVYRNKQLHYLYPLYKNFLNKQKDTLAWRVQMQRESLSQMISYTGDYKTALLIEAKGYEPLSDSARTEIRNRIALAKGSVYTDARQYIDSLARHHRVVMINEATNKPLHRAFTASLLTRLYQQGFRYLAMKTLSTKSPGSLRRITMHTGQTTSEPIGGELVRMALELGYRLLPYEDTARQPTPNQRHHAQALQLHQALIKDSSAKILVLDEYDNIEEGARTGNIPMAAYFKILSGLDPLTIDQTQFSEGSNDAYGAFWYEAWMGAYPATSPVISLLNGKALDPMEVYLTDLTLIHPPTLYRNARPTWMSINGIKKETAISPSYRSLFFVQAYAANEYDEKRLGLLVPADQTYELASDGYYYLYLRKGSYKLVFRDKAYQVLGSRDLTVK